MVLCSRGIWGSAHPGTGTELCVGLSLCTCLESGTWGQPEPAGEVSKFTCMWVSALFTSSRASRGLSARAGPRHRSWGFSAASGWWLGHPMSAPLLARSCAVVHKAGTRSRSSPGPSG